MSEWKSESIAKLAEALAKAQTEFEKVLKDTENPAYMRGGKAMKYADLATVIGATQPALARNGITIIQMPDISVADQSMTLTGLMVHSSGEWIKHSLCLPAVQRDRFDAQSCGSAITYARRYQYAAMVGAAQEDDDANAASGVGSAAAQAAVVERKLAQAKSVEAANSAARLSVELKPFQEDCLSIHGTQEALVKLVTAGLAKSAVYAEVAGLYFIPMDKAESFASWSFKQGVDVKMPVAVPKPVDSEPFVPSDADLPEMFQAPVMSAVKSIQGKFLVFNWDGKERSCWHKSMWALLTENQNKPAELSCVDKEKGGKSYSNVEGIISLNGVEYEIGQDEHWHPVIQRDAQ